MIERRGTKIKLVCDDCSEEHEPFHMDDFKEMIRVAKEDGWTIEKDENDEWVHWCPDCR